MVGWRCVNSATTQGQRCRKRLSGAAWLHGNVCGNATVPRRYLRSEGRKPQAWESRESRVLVTTESAATTGERYPAPMAAGASCAFGGASQQAHGARFLTRPA